MAGDLPRLDLPAEEGARLLALARIAEVEEAAARLGAGDDGEALHDLRVALRRLRTLLRAFRPWLDGGPRRRHVRAVGALAASTNEARDAEVQLAWLGEQRERLPPERRGGLEWLVARLEARREAAEAEPARVTRRWRRLSRRLRRRLSSYERRLRPLEVEPLGGVLGALLGTQAERFLGALAAVRGADDVERAHRARIEGKRLRYLLEPVRARRDLGARPAVERLRALQDLLGALHDAHVLEDELGRARREAAAAGARPPALSPVLRLVRARRDRLYGALARSSEEVTALAVEVRRVAGRLAAEGATGWIGRPADGIGGRDDHASPQVHGGPRPDVDVGEAAGEPRQGR